MSKLEKYCKDVIDGKIVSCEKLKRQCEKLIDDIYNPGEYHFDEDMANRHVGFIATFCKTPSGKIGTPLALQDFQIAQLQAVFGFVDDNDLRRYNEVLIIEGRKNGKSTLLSAVLLDMLMNDGEGAPQCYTAATQLDQAKITFTAAHKMVIQSPMLSKHIRKRAADLYFPKNLGYIKALASNTNSLDGLDVSCAVIDELSALKNRDVYDLIKQGTSARQQPLIFCITTNGFVRKSVFDAQYDYATNIIYGDADNPHFLPLIYELDDPKEWTDEDKWMKANPGLGTIKSWDYQRQMVQKAHDDIAFKPTVLVKDFNIPQTSETAWLRYEELHNEALFDISDFRYCLGSFDAADSIDLNSAKLIFARPNDDKVYFFSMYWIPESVLEEQHLRGDRKGRDSVDYQLWVDQGYMRTCPGNKCDKKIFLEWFREMAEQYHLIIQKIYYDPWHVSDDLLREFSYEFGKKCMVPVRQGVYSLSQPMKDLKAAFNAHNIVYNNNPVDEWCLYNTEVKTDINGNIQPVKSLDNRRRIDGSVTFIMGYKGYQDIGETVFSMNEGLKDGII